MTQEREKKDRGRDKKDSGDRPLGKQSNQMLLTGTQPKARPLGELTGSVGRALGTFSVSPSLSLPAPTTAKIMKYLFYPMRGHMGRVVSRDPLTTTVQEHRLAVKDRHLSQPRPQWCSCYKREQG